LNASWEGQKRASSAFNTAELSSAFNTAGYAPLWEQRTFFEIETRIPVREKNDERHDRPMWEDVKSCEWYPVLAPRKIMQKSSFSVNSALERGANPACHSRKVWFNGSTEDAEDHGRPLIEMVLQITDGPIDTFFFEVQYEISTGKISKQMRNESPERSCWSSSTHPAILKNRQTRAVAAHHNRDQMLLDGPLVHAARVSPV